MQNLAALHCHNNSTTAASPKICCDRFCEAFKCKQQLLWTEATTMHQNWANAMCNAYQSASDVMCYRIMDKLSGVYIAPLSRTAELMKNELIP